TPPPVESESLSAEEFALRASAKYEEELQNRGILVPPGHEGDPEPLDPVDAPEEEEEEPIQPPPVAEEEPEAQPEPEVEDGEFFLNVGSSRYKTAEEAARGFREKDLTIQRLQAERDQRNRLEEELKKQQEE